MTQEQKELLLKDLCSRLPYGVIVKDRNRVHELTAGNTEFTDLLYNSKCNIRPYLFPFSSMTEEQREELFIVVLDEQVSVSKYEFTDMTGYSNVSIHRILDAIDWLNKNHFDYRGLIEKSLAIDATGLNIY